VSSRSITNCRRPPSRARNCNVRRDRRRYKKVLNTKDDAALYEPPAAGGATGVKGGGPAGGPNGGGGRRVAVRAGAGGAADDSSVASSVASGGTLHGSSAIMLAAATRKSNAAQKHASGSHHGAAAHGGGAQSVTSVAREALARARRNAEIKQRHPPPLLVFGRERLTKLVHQAMAHEFERLMWAMHHFRSQITSLRRQVRPSRVVARRVVARSLFLVRCGRRASSLVARWRTRARPRFLVHARTHARALRASLGRCHSVVVGSPSGGGLGSSVGMEASSAR